MVNNYKINTFHSGLFYNKAKINLNKKTVAKIFKLKMSVERKENY